MKKNTLLTIGSIYLVAGLVAACASTPSPSNNETPSSSAPGESKPKGPSAADVRDKYTISQLDGAAIAMKVIGSAAADPKKDAGTEVIGCPVTTAQARAWQASIRFLIEDRLSSERDAYSADPSSYGDSNSFETCANSCSCSVLSSVVRGARTNGMKPKDLKYHERWVARLKLKASAISEREERTCAARQTWICGSDLMSYLQSQP